MFQTDQPTAASSIPTPATAGTQGYFTNGNPAGGVPATIVDADWMNMIQQELINIVTAAGETPSKTTYNQVLLAIKRLVQNQVVLTDTGTANAYAAANTPALVSGTWANGVVQQFIVAHTNTGASTYSPDTLTAIPIYGLGLQALQGGEMFAGGTAILMKQTITGVNSGNPIAILLECSGGAQQIAPATAPNHAAQLSQVLGKQKFITSSTTFTVPAGVTTIYATVVPAAGGGGGGASAQGSASTSGAAGGGGGGGAGTPLIKSPITVAPGQVLTVSIGAPGSGGAGSQAIGTPASSGTAGGTTTITGSGPTVNLSAAGGSGGSVGSNANGSSANSVTGGGQCGSVTAGGGLYGILGSGAAFGGVGGAGASSLFGQGGGAPFPNGGASPGTAGNNGAGYGSGGSGGNGGSALSTLNVEGGGLGGNGTGAAVLLEW